MRRVADLVAYSMLYELEDVARELLGAEIVAPAERPRERLQRRLHRATRLLTGSHRLWQWASSHFTRTEPLASYELFLPMLNHPHELFALTALPDWRRRCHKAVCYIAEAWRADLSDHLIELLADFDHVFLGVSHPVAEVARITGRPCSYLPLGVDALGFCPYPRLPQRAVDVCGIGRRSPVTHAALLELARARDFFYYYDTVRLSTLDKQMTFRVGQPAEHRLLLANLLVRSRYFVANRARANEPELTMGRDEIAGRYFEGTAAGTILLGDPPRTKAFREHFDWQDAVVETPFDSPDIGELISKLDGDPLRSARIRRENVRQALLRHDCVYRVGAMLRAVALPPSPRMLEREARLRALADEVAASPLEAW